MDSATMDLFLEGEESACLFGGFGYWELVEHPENWKATLLEAVSFFEERAPFEPHYWSGDIRKLEQFADDTATYLNTGKYLSAETLAVRSNLLNIAEKIQLFGISVIRAIDGTPAGTSTQNLSQAQIDVFDSSLLSIEDIGCVQNFSSHMDALRYSISSAMDEVSTFQSKISELKVLLANSVRPTVDGALASINHPYYIGNAPPGIMESINEPSANPRRFITLDASQRAALRFSPLLFNNIVETFEQLSQALSRLQPGLSKFEILWIETCSFIQNSKTNADTIKDIRMLKVFRVRMKKIIEDWSDVQKTLGAQPVIMQ